MHLLLTDRLACPRCGPEFGLILLADEMADRRVRRGHLGCPNCRDQYPIRDGRADLRPPPRTAPEPADPGRTGTPVPLDPMALAAMLGIREGPGIVLLLGSAAGAAAALDGIVPGIHWVVEEGPEWTEAPPADPGSGVNPVRLRGRIPFFSRSLRGVVVPGGSGRLPLEEAVRAVAPLGRVVIPDPLEGDLGALTAAGLHPLLDTPEAVVAQRKS